MKSVKGAKKALKKLLGSKPMQHKGTPKEYMITDRDGGVDTGLSARSFADAVERCNRNRKMEEERLIAKVKGTKVGTRIKKEKKPKVEKVKRPKSKQKGGGDEE